MAKSRFAIGISSEIFEYGYIAVDPLDPNILYGDWPRDQNKISASTRKVTPEPIRRGEYRYARTLPVVFFAARTTHLYFAANVLFKNDGMRETGCRSSVRISRAILRDPRQPRCFRRERSGKREASRRNLRRRSFLQGSKHDLAAPTTD